MFQYIIKRCLYLIPIMGAVTFLTFLMLYFAPSDPITMQYRLMLTAGNHQDIELKKEELGLNDPFIKQYGRWLNNSLKGDFGMSIKYRKPVKDEMMKRLPNTLALSGTVLVLIILFAIPLGILSAVYKNKFWDYFIRSISFIGVSTPTFWVGLLLMYFLSVKLRIFPSMGNKGIKSLVMPSITLSFWFIALYIRRLRTSILEEINKDYVIGLQSRGISFKRIILFHILPNSFITLLTMFGMSIGQILGGTAVIEKVFDYQGIGKMATEAITARDYFVIQAYVIWITFMYVLVNLIVDIFQKFFNPKMRFGVDER